MILVFGATGQLGTAVVKLLRAEGREVRVFVRSEAAAQRFEAMGCESYIGDMTHQGMAKGPFPRVGTVIATANASIPTRKGDTLSAVDDLGYRNVIEAARDSGAVRQFIYVSVTGGPEVERVPILRFKRLNESRLEGSGLGFTVVRVPAFMDVAFPMMGSGLAVRGTENASVARDFAFVRSQFEKIRHAVERDGVIHLGGDGSRRHAYIAVDDVAKLLVACAGRPEMIKRVIEVTGPESLSGEEVAQIHEKVLGRMLKRKYTPAMVFGVLSKILAPFNPAAANLMAINHLSVTTDTPVMGQEKAKELGVELKTVEAFLREKLALSNGTKPPADAAASVRLASEES